MFSDPQKQKLVNDLFIESVRQNYSLSKARYENGEPTSETVEMLQKEYDQCRKIVESLNL